MSRRRRPLASRARGFVRQLLAFLFSNVGVIVLVVGYTIAGAFMFQAIEGASEMERVNLMAAERNSTAHYLWQNVTLTLNLFNETALKDRISIELQRYQVKVVFAVRRGWDGGRSSRQWSFSGAFLYCLTVITTIGYGHLSPRTSWGKIITVLYTLLGMPLFLLYLSNLGELLAQWCKCLYALVCLCRGCPGFTRRRVARLRAQIDNNISEAESIERPEDWSSSEVMQYRPHSGPPHFQRPEYLRSVSMPQPYDHHLNHRDIRFPIYDRDNRIDPRIRSYTLDPRDPRLRGHSRDPIMAYGDPRYLRNSTIDPRFRGRIPPRDVREGWVDPRLLHTRDPRLRCWLDPRDDMLRDLDPRFRGWSEPLRREAASSSEFSYITFDAQTITVPISVCVFIMVGYIIFGSMIFGLWEKWDQLDGAYFCFISLSSIGFGDIVPGERVYTPRVETSFIVCSLYLMLGMALVAMCFNLMQEQVIHYVAGLKRAARRICRCKR
ncbi:potassium channel subfamily K member 18-like isoform X2 [Plodia interpunctella]|uniref:potassium channel subfamily K member 18-like isoform X2 n=1 Tax=Plodia interpunctella TaxID=58824 RepID=UPI002367C9FF|nr:potassium channel subfamily K member 18-like isoform X2 [Plodia interpunctella]